MKVFINNQSDAVLRFGGDEIVHGDYTPGWRPPDAINPGERKGFERPGSRAAEQRDEVAPSHT